ncbi:hypothetical protein Salat_0759800 [Sesamum alatum]|uniref:Nodulin-like domain-containing protein n=1 Tax=Sesamum alatum TaxID=300844 RepID=A0AAE1YTZ2_9LAMI|nr:hypothetical protein Salat_0759800 [Sesamum alatum]
MGEQSAAPQPPPPSGGCGPCRFTKQVLVGRWFMMFASFLIMAGAGATYLFGVYSKVIKSTLGYDQSTLNLLGSCKDLGANVGVLSGLMAEVTPTWFVLLVGSALNFAGYFMIWLAVTKKISKPSVWQMCIYICVGANSQNFANTARSLRASRTSRSSLRTMKVSRHPNEVKVFYEYLIISCRLWPLCLMGLQLHKTFREEFATFEVEKEASRLGPVFSRVVLLRSRAPNGFSQDSSLKNFLLEVESPKNPYDDIRTPYYTLHRSSDLKYYSDPLQLRPIVRALLDRNILNVRIVGEIVRSRGDEAARSLEA